MTTAVGEMLKRVEQLSTEEQLELTAKLTERLEHRIEKATNANGLVEDPAAVLQAQADIESGLPEESEDDEIPDVFSLNRVPPQRTYTMRVKYKFVGRGKPRPYPLDDEA